MKSLCCASASKGRSDTLCDKARYQGVTLCCVFFQNVMTSQVLRDHLEATYITVESASFYGVKAEPSRVLVNSQDAAFTYRANQVRPSW